MTAIKPTDTGQSFKTSKPNEVWVGDITYRKTTIGWVYLAVVVDLFNREIIGYAISKKINADLVAHMITLVLIVFSLR